MKEYVLNEKDYKWLDEIIKVTTSIESLYKKMYELEISGKKNTEEYNKLLEYLNISLEVEDDLYKRENLNSASCGAFINHIKELLPDEFLSDLESLMEQDYRGRILRRILNVLISTIKTDYNSIEEAIPDRLKLLMEHVGIDDPDKIISHAVYSSVELQKAFEIDTINGFLSFIQEYIDKKDYEDIRERLIQAKYNTAFINKDVEDEMRVTFFEIPTLLYNNSKLVADYTKTDDHLLETLKDTHASKECIMQISKLLEMRDIEYDTDMGTCSSILRQCLLRSTFLLMSEEAITEINYQFHCFIEEDEYIDDHMEDHLSEDAVIKCFKSINKDKNKTLYYQ